MTISGGPGPALQAALAVPAGARRAVAVCHPHPLYGGDMDSPIVTVAVQACAQAGLATLRFNFRGVGGSAGAWDEGRGEQDDVRAALAHLRGHLPADGRVALAGYSFGASMAAAVASRGEQLAGLALIAPPLAMRQWQPPLSVRIDGPILLVAGSADDYCPPNALAALGQVLPKATVVVIDGADHFFFTDPVRLARALEGWAAAIS